ncbi:uromodulin-like [Amia ocellicauda]|uniref:uromodulin-like n=1 Tax=Amia ocellicauda TaxID=2972642 RepID=UPI003464DBB7
MLKIGHLVLLLFMPVVCANKAGTFTACSQCSENTVCASLNESVRLSDSNSYAQSVTCNCIKGFVGDGVNCYNATECESNQDCCAPGFRWSSHDGCVDIDECSVPRKDCQSPLICENTMGSFHCLSESESHPSARSVRFSCAKQLCQAGEDCLEGAGESRCSDPCQNYIVLSEPWRWTNFTENSDSDVKCDSGLSGWYRLMDTLGVRMPDACVPVQRCGAHAPMWINGIHPLPEEGVVSRESCGHWTSGCCQFRRQVLIKACPGPFYVYKFDGTPGCSLVYCAEIPNPTPELLCGHKQMQIGLDRCHLESKGLNISSAQLEGNSCQGYEERNKLVWFKMGRKEGDCGTRLMTNGTHAIYNNTLIIHGNKVGSVYLVPAASFPFSCAYPLDLKTSLEVAIQPVQTTLELRVSGVGSTTTTMSLYQDSNYTEPFTAGSVSLPLTSTLFVGVFVEDIEEAQFSVILEDCYATPTADDRDAVRFFIIQNRCPNDLASVSMDENGVSLQARFSVKLFRFVGDYNSVYLHCGILVCDSTAASCTPVRYQEPPVQSSVSAGTGALGIIVGCLLQLTLLLNI